MQKIILLHLLILISYFSFSQSIETPKGWHLLDAATDGYNGVSIQKAYSFLKSKNLKSKTIVVGVLDSGLDTLQEDLKEILWLNTKEIPNNNIDDDKNGYVDDVHGWNFLGNSKGENIGKADQELARFYHLHKAKFYNKNIDESKLNKNDVRMYKLWLKTSKSLDISEEKHFETTMLKLALNNIKSCSKVLKKEMGVDDFTGNEVEKLKPSNNEAKASKQNYLINLMLLQIDNDEKYSSLVTQLEEAISQAQKAEKAKEESPIDIRKKIINDDYNNLQNKFYGNKDITASFPMHGTHVSGIIAAQRDNKIGADGVADNAKIMTLRVVPDGDEYDKDIALGIFYAVDNGAKVINMSFGKEMSPEKNWVDSAFKYAASKDVLIVHAAGNDSENIDSTDNFPNTHFEDGTTATNVITVGASTDPKISGAGFVADFSNYGKNDVDVFAPGIKIYSTMPGATSYGNLQGTSMAAPVVAGVAALIRSYFPSLSAIQVKSIIEKSVVVPTENTTPEKSIMGISLKGTKLQDACKTGGIVNAYNAVVLAYKICYEK